QLEDFAAHVHGDLFGEIAIGHGGGDFGDVADLASEVGSHEVDVVSEVLPSAGHAGQLGLPAELALRADFARHACHFRGETVELIDHGVDRVFERQDFSFDIDCDLA